MSTKHNDHEVQLIRTIQQIHLVKLRPCPDQEIAESAYFVEGEEPFEEEIKYEYVFCVTCGDEMDAVDKDIFDDEDFEEE